MNIATYNAFRFIGTLTGGTTRPWLIEVDTGSPYPELFVLKLFPDKFLNQQSHIAHEIMGSLLAKEMDLPTPDVAFVKLSESFKSTVPPKQLLDLEQCSNELFFASRYFTSATEYSDALQLRYLTKDDIPSILAFDMLVYNIDRTKRKPNLLFSEKKFYLIDHEAAFAHANPEMNQIGYILKNHLLYNKTKSLYRKNKDCFDSFQFYMESLRLNNIHEALDQLEALNLSTPKERMWLEYISREAKEPSKFINLLKELIT